MTKQITQLSLLFIAISALASCGPKWTETETNGVAHCEK